MGSFSFVFSENSGLENRLYDQENIPHNIF